MQGLLEYVYFQGSTCPDFGWNNFGDDIAWLQIIAQRSSDQSLGYHVIKYAN